MTPSRDAVEVEVIGFEEIHARPETWEAQRLRTLLERLDYEDGGTADDAELEDLAVMAAQDLGLREASERVLDVVFEGALTPGQRQNLVDDLRAERPWELHASLPRQAKLFDAVVFLQKAFGTELGVPDAARVRLRLTALGPDAARSLRGPLDPAWLVRLMADAMDARSVLRRLYAEQLASTSFPEAASILWSVTVTRDGRDEDPPRCELEVVSSLQWLGALRTATGVHLSSARPDVRASSNAREA